jgi:hypothetical protein
MISGLQILLAQLWTRRLACRPRVNPPNITHRQVFCPSLSPIPSPSHRTQLISAAQSLNPALHASLDAQAAMRHHAAACLAAFRAHAKSHAAASAATTFDAVRAAGVTMHEGEWVACCRAQPAACRLSARVCAAVFRCVQQVRAF